MNSWDCTDCLQRAGRKSPNHFCSPQEKLPFLLIELRIQLAIFKGIFEALTL